MRTMTVIGCVIAACCGGASVAYGQSNADTTCVDFMNMDASAQAALVAGLPPMDGGAGADMSKAPNGNDAAGDTQLTTIVTACQNDPSLTVGEAVTQGNSGGMQDPTAKPAP